ncbi:MAG: MerR family transcriptional regulator [Alkalibacterium sp.]
MKSSKYLKISELAQLVHINKRTLHYYDDIGLFSPEFKDQNGYRYYAMTQIMDLSIILSLRELGMPLDEIKDILTGEFDEYTLALEHKLEDINSKIREMHNIRNIISRKLTYIETAERSHMDINRIALEDSYLILSDPLKDPSLLNVLNEAHQLVDQRSNYTLPNNEYGFMISTAKKQKNPKDDAYDYLYIDAPIDDKRHHLKPAGDYLSLVYQGNEDTLFLPYRKLIDYCRKENIDIEGYFYEKVLLDSIQKNQDNLVSEIQVKIKE